MRSIALLIDVYNLTFIQCTYVLFSTKFWQLVSYMNFIVAYMCHHNSFLIYDSLAEPTEKRWGTVTHISVLVAMICTFVLGVTGYATFTGYSQGMF